MAAFFGLFKPKVMYHKELPSRERIVRILQEHIVPDMEARGFSFNVKEVRFKRDRGDQVDVIDHNINKRNSTPHWVQFYPFWHVQCRSYGRWLREHVGEHNADGLLIAGKLNDISDRADKIMGAGWFDLAGTDNKKLIDYYHGVLINELVPLMENMDPLTNVLTWRSARGKHDVELACMLGDMKEARASMVRYEKSIADVLDDPGVIRRREQLRQLIEKFS